jgi:multidrug efflux pump subunit AcrB
VDVPNQDGSLIPGMYAEVHLHLGARPNVLSVSLDAVDGIGTTAEQVWVVRNSTVHLTPVTTGLETANRIEILAGIKAGDQVIVGRHSGLSDGERVHTVPATYESAGIYPPLTREEATAGMSGFSIRNPYLIVVLCLIIAILDVVSVSDMPVDMFPPVNLPVVAVATFYSGMPPQQIETNITYHLERQFTLASGIEHMESRSLPGVSLIKIYFRAGTNPDTAAASISSLAMSDLRDMPPGTYPPIILKQDASNVPVALVTLTGSGLSESKLKDIGQNYVRNQLASVVGASVPQPFGGTWRQIQLFADPYKLEANQLSPMDVVRAINNANVILPAGDAQIGRYDYDIYTNSMLKGPSDIAQVPIKTVGQSPVRVGDVATPEDAFGRQYNIVRVDGQRAVYIPIFKGGADSNTIAIVDGVRAILKKLYDVPSSLHTAVVFDQARFVRNAIETLIHEGGIGLFLTCLMILLFLCSLRATVAVFFSIPLSLLATFFVLHLAGSSINSMVLGGLALALSRLIDNSVVVLENIFRHLEGGEAPAVAAEKGGCEVALPVLAGTLTTAVVFSPLPCFMASVSFFSPRWRWQSSFRSSPRTSSP